MMPFRYFLDTAYVVPNLRRRELGLPMNRRKTAIVGLVLAIHAGLIWVLVNFITPTPPPIEFVETQVILEQITPEQPMPTPILPSPQVQQRVVDTPVVQHKPVLKVNEKAVIKETIKPTAPAPVAPIAPIAPPAPAALSVSPVVPPSNPVAAASTVAGCGSSVPLSIDATGLIEDSTRVRIKIVRNERQVASASILQSTGSGALDALIMRKVYGLRFYKKGAECDGLSFIVSQPVTVH